MTLDQFEIMTAALRLGLQLATLACGISLAGVIISMSNRVSFTSLVFITEGIVRQSWLGVILMVVSTLFTLLERTSSLLLLMSFVNDGELLTFLDRMLLPLIVTVLQFCGVFVLRDAALDCRYLNYNDDEEGE